MSCVVLVFPGAGAIIIIIWNGSAISHHLLQDVFVVNARQRTVCGQFLLNDSSLSYVRKLWYAYAILFHLLCVSPFMFCAVECFRHPAVCVCKCVCARARATYHVHDIYIPLDFGVYATQQIVLFEPKRSETD